MDLSAGAGASLENLPLGAFGIWVAAVAVKLFEVGFSEAFEDFGLRAFGVIASEEDHNNIKCLVHANIALCLLRAKSQCRLGV